MKDEAQRIYVGDCGCVRIESKHSRITMKLEKFVELLRNLVNKQNDEELSADVLFFRQISITNNIKSSGSVVSLSRKREKQK